VTEFELNTARSVKMFVEIATLPEIITRKNPSSVGNRIEIYAEKMDIHSPRARICGARFRNISKLN